jgi:hypothetical protein
MNVSVTTVYSLSYNENRMIEILQPIAKHQLVPFSVPGTLRSNTGTGTRIKGL